MNQALGFDVVYVKQKGIIIAIVPQKMESNLLTLFLMTIKVRKIIHFDNMIFLCNVFKFLVILMLIRINGYLLYAGITARWIRQFYMDRAHTGHLQHGQVLTLRSFIIDIVRRFSIATVHLMGVLFYYCSRQTSIVLHTQDSFPQIGTLLLHLSRDGNLRLIPSTYLRESAQLHYMTLPFFLDYQQIKLQLLVIHVQIGYVYINLYQDSLLEIQTQMASAFILHG